MMSLKENLELKKYCHNFPEIRKILESLGARKEIVKHQKDYFFNLSETNIQKKGRLKLRIEDGKRKELIYYERPDFKEGTQAQSFIQLYDVQDNRLLDFLINSLGEMGIVDKKREVWRLKNTVFHLDSVKGVGDIFEIELQKENGINEDDKELFENYQSELNPFLGEMISGSNIDLVLNK